MTIRSFTPCYVESAEDNFFKDLASPPSKAQYERLAENSTSEYPRLNRKVHVPMHRVLTERVCTSLISPSAKQIYPENMGLSPIDRPKIHISCQFHLYQISPLSVKKNLWIIRGQIRFARHTGLDRVGESGNNANIRVLFAPLLFLPSYSPASRSFFICLRVAIY